MDIPSSLLQPCHWVIILQEDPHEALNAVRQWNHRSKPTEFSRQTLWEPRTLCGASSSLLVSYTCQDNRLNGNEFSESLHTIAWLCTEVEPKSYCGKHRMYRGSKDSESRSNSRFGKTSNVCPDKNSSLTHLYTSFAKRFLSIPTAIFTCIDNSI